MEESPIREIKPVVVPAQYFVLGPLIASFVSLFPGFFTFVISQMFGDPFERLGSGPDPTYGIVVFLLAFVACMTHLWFSLYPCCGVLQTVSVTAARIGGCFVKGGAFSIRSA